MQRLNLSIILNLEYQTLIDLTVNLSVIVNLEYQPIIYVYVYMYIC